MLDKERFTSPVCKKQKRVQPVFDEQTVAARN